MQYYRAVWISDIHLGTPRCQADLLLKFLHNCEMQSLYLVGDILDIEALKRSRYWKQEFWTVIQKILRFSRKHVEVKYVCGNHDAMIRHYFDEMGLLNLEGIQFCDYWYHFSQKGKKGLVVHGDKFDGAIRSMPWLYWFGDLAYSLSLFLNRIFNSFRKLFGFNYWSLSAWLKRKVKSAVNYINNFENLVVKEAHQHQADFVVCGHIHFAQIRKFGNIIYCNCGDWCESCTALVEDLDGTLRIVNHKHETLCKLVLTYDGINSSVIAH